MSKIARATLRNLRISPTKLNLVAELIRGMDASQALVQLQFSKKRISQNVKKLLESAIANAENNHMLDIDRLYVSQVQIGKGISMRRYRARARGRAGSIRKFFSNVTIELQEKVEG